MTRRRRARGPLGRVLLVVLGLGLGLVASEAALQVLRAARLVRVEPTPRSTGPGPVVVCVGDSHTAGFLVQRDLESYPAQLQRRVAAMGVQVENLGWPGLNGAQVVGRLRQRLDAGRVDLVLALVGYNNSWNPATAESRSRWVLPRLWRILHSRGAGQGPDGLVIVDGRPHWRQPDGSLRPIAPAEAEEALREGRALEDSVAQDLGRLVDLCQERGVPVVLQTYASEQNGRFLAPNAAARSVAAARDVPLVDHGRWFQEHDVDEAVALQPDGHPTPAGYAHMVAALVASLPALAATQDWRWEALDQPVNGAAPGPGTIAMGPAREEADGTLVIPLSGSPGGTWMLGVSRRTTGATEGLALERDEAFERCRVLDGLSGTLDDRGQATARLYPHLAAQLGPGPFHLQALLLDPLAPPESLLRAASTEVRTLPAWPR